MPITSVVNIRHRKAEVYIGRPSSWGNPFREGPTCTREEAIEKYRRYILARPDLLARLPTLKGKTLGCWCKPLPCHGDVLVELVETLTDAEEGEQTKETHA